MVTVDQDFTVVRGDDIQQPFTITLDQSRVLDGTETWRLHIRSRKTDSAALVTLVSPNEITIDATTKQPTAVFTPSTLTIALFPARTKDRNYDYDLEMTKDTLVETVVIGKITVITDVSRD